MSHGGRVPAAVVLARLGARDRSNQVRASTGDTEADVAIVGAGLTGLWTAYYLNKIDPELTIAICEREIAGFGASGRNGGWCSALFPASLAKLERMAGREQAVAMYRAMQQTVDEVGRVATDRGHRLPLGQGRHRLVRAVAEPAASGPGKRWREARMYGFDETDLRLLTAEEARDSAAGLRRARRRLHAALRGDPPGPAGARAGRACSASAGVQHLRADRRCSGSSPGGWSPRTGRSRPGT